MMYVNVLSVEMASSFGWHKYVGLDGIVMSIDEFGRSAPANQVIESFGFTVDKVVENVEKLVNKGLALIFFTNFSITS